MTSPEHKLLFPSFSKLKQSPTKNSILVKEMSENTNSHMKQFLQSKILKGIKLNKLNQVQSIHESVYREESSQQNTVRNIVNSSYFNASQQSVSKIIDSNQLKLNDASYNKLPCDSNSKKIAKFQLRQEFPITRRENDQYSDKRGVQKQRQQLRIKNIRSLSSSKISNSKSQFTTKNIFALTDRQKQIHLPTLPSLQSSIYEFIQSQEKKKKLEQQKSKLPLQDQVQGLLDQNYDKDFIRNLVQYMNKDWSKQQGSLMQDRKVRMLLNIMSSKYASFSQLISDFLSREFAISYLTPVQTMERYTLRQTKLLTSILFKQCQRTFTEMKKLFQELVAKLPEQGIIQQEFQLDQLKKTVLQIYDPKYAYSSAKIKERFQLYYEVYCIKRNSLQTEIKHKLKPQLTFIKTIQTYLSSYQKELIRLNAQINTLQSEKSHLFKLLQQKTTFQPIQMDLNQLAQLKQEAQQKIKADLQTNIVSFHNKLHQKNKQTIEDLLQQNKLLKKQLEQSQKQKQLYIDKLEDYLNSIPFKKDQSTQIFYIPSTTMSQTSVLPSQLKLPPFESPMFTNFLHNITSPFAFNEKITRSLISIITIDKILYDYEPIKLKMPITPFRHYIYEWFIIRTGSKKIAQILLKNFLFSVKKYRNKHKRFSIFNKICGYSEFRGKNLQQDIEHLFYQSNLAWYYIVKIALVYRKKLSDSATGYHIFPPLNCEQIFKLSLRKSYEIIEQFFIQEEIGVPQNLNQKIDHYAINEISKFKQSDEEFQKQSLQQIHILRQLNFDVIVGFIIDYIASQKALVLQAFLRSIHLKNQENKNPIGYGQFQVIYRKYYKQKRSKIEIIYSKFCMCNMLDVLNAESMCQMLMFCMEDESPLRSIFQKNETLKSLILSEKQSIALSVKYDKKTLPNPNSFDHFKERFYYQFYDFYDMTIMLQEIFKIARSLLKKRLRKINNQQNQIQSLLQIPKGEIVGQKQQTPPEKQDDESEQDQFSSDEQQESQKSEKNEKSLQKLASEKSFIQQKLEQWKQIQERIPHFTTNILTIQQIIINNMRRKQMLEGCEFAWRTLRQILVFITQ